MITVVVIGILSFLLLVAQQMVYQKLWLKNLSVDIRFSTDHIFEDGTAELRETIENRKRLPLSMLKVKFMTDRRLVFGSAKGSRTTDNYYRNDVFSIGGGERIIRTLKFRGSRRGYYTIKELSLVASDLFFMSQMNADIPIKYDALELYVYPKPYDSAELRRALIYLNGDMVTKRHLLEDPFEYRGIREYQPYDDMRSINWKATAKTGELKVNQRNYTAFKNARVFFDCDLHGDGRDDEDAAEITLRVTSSLCSYFLKQGMQVSCFGNGADILTHEPVCVPSGGGNRHLDHIYRKLARVDTSQPTVSFAQTFHDTVFEASGGALNCFVSVGQDDEFVKLLAGYQDTGSHFLWFYPVLKHRLPPKLPPAVAKNIRVLHLDV